MGPHMPKTMLNKDVNSSVDKVKPEKKELFKNWRSSEMVTISVTNTIFLCLYVHGIFSLTLGLICDPYPYS